MTSRFKGLTPDEVESQKIAESLHSLAYAIQETDKNAAIEYFEEMLSCMIRPIPILQLLILSDDENKDIEYLNMFIEKADAYNYRMYLIAMEEHSQFADLINNALETGESLKVNDKYILRQFDTKPYIDLLHKLNKHGNL